MKRILTLCFLLGVFYVADAQTVRMGIVAAPEISWLKSDNPSVSTDGAKMGFRFGLETDLFFLERYSVSTGLFINSTGGGLKFADSLVFKGNNQTYTLDKNASIKYKVQYVDVPLSFKMESNKIGYFVFYAKFGVINHFRVGANADIKDVTLGEVKGVGCKKEVGFFNMSYTVEAGTMYYFSKNTAVSLGLSFVNGFLDLTRNADNTIQDKTSLKQICLNVGFVF